MGEWPTGYGRHVFDRVTSTLSVAADMIPDLREPTWILAHEQTAARGRRGRSWATPRGNFAATLVMRHDGPPGQAALRSFVVSLALFRTLDRLAPGRDFALKWPNDVLLEGRKLAGILLENIGDHLLIGVGINLAHVPDHGVLERDALAPISLPMLQAEVVLDVLAAEFAELEMQFRTVGFAPIREAWLAHAARLGEVITARTTRAQTTGVFEDVDETGNLLLRTDKGRVAIAAADVFF